MSDSNRTRVGIVEESTYGEIPDNPTFKIFRHTSSSLSAAPETTASEEIREDRQITDLPLVGMEASGDLGFELSFESFDDLIEGAFFSDWTETPSVEGGDISDVGDTSADAVTMASGGDAIPADAVVLHTGFADAANNGTFFIDGEPTATTITYDSPNFTSQTDVSEDAKIKVAGFRTDADDIVVDGPGKFISSTATDFSLYTYDESNRPWGLREGMWVILKGFTNTANNGYARITAVADNQISFDVVPVDWTTESADTNQIQILFGDYVRNGVTEHSYSVQQSYLGNIPAESKHMYLKGMEVSSMNMSLEAQSIMTGTFNFMGKVGQYVNADYDGEVTFGPNDTMTVSSGEPSGTTRTQPPSTDVLNTSSNVGRIAMDGDVITGPNFIMSAEFTVDNELRMQPAVGNLGAIGIGAGTCSVTGTLSSYFGNADLIQKAITNEDTSLDFRVGNDEGVMLFDFPRVKLSSGEAPISGQNEDVMAELEFQAIRHPDFGYQVHAQKFYVT